MKQLFKTLSIAALALAGALLVGCTELENPGQAENVGTVTLTTTITLEDGAWTKALDENGHKTFVENEKIAVFYTNTSDETQRAEGTVTAVSNSGKNATLSVSLTDPKANGTLRIIYPAKASLSTIAKTATIQYASTIDLIRFGSQGGTLESLNDLDIAIYHGSLTNSAGLPDNPVLENRLAICKFTVKDGSSDITSQVMQLTLSDGTRGYVVNRTTNTGPIFVAVIPAASATFTLSATTASAAYKNKNAITGQTLAANELYPITVEMKEDTDRSTPLTFEAIANMQLTFRLPTGASVQYRAFLSTGKWGDWYDYTGTTILIEAGYKVQFRGKNNTYANISSDGNGNFIADRDCYVYGNIMSLVTDWGSDPNAFVTNVTIPADQAFYRLFKNNTHIKNHETIPLILPATTLKSSCYEEMFQGCIALTIAPDLPATTLAGSCYKNMFRGCTELTTAPALPAMALAGNCYFAMFNGCSNLSTAPALPAMTLAASCYEAMFSGCVNLTTVPALSATTLANRCYDEMFNGCTKLSSVPELPATVLADNCYEQMFKDCTNLETAPALPAKTLASCCYSGMF